MRRAPPMSGELDRRIEAEGLLKESVNLIRKLLDLHGQGKTEDMALEAAYFAGKFTSYCDRYEVPYE